MKDLINKVFYDKKFTDTRIGTNSKYEYSNGNTLPLVGVPYGQNYFAVQTAQSRGSWWFNPKDVSFEGFRLTHQPSPWMGDFAYLTILPFSKVNMVDYYPNTSVFRACVNKIEYMDGTTAILAASKYDAIISYQAENPINFQIKSNGLFLSEQDGLIVGYVSNYADCEDKEFKMYLVFQTNSKSSLKEVSEGEYVISLDSNSGELHLSTSFISQEQALFNFSKMIKNQKQMVEDSVRVWEKYIDKIEISNTLGNSMYDKFERYEREDQEKFFYHSMYRSFLFPMSFYEVDVDGNELHYDTYSKTVKPGKLFTNIGFWDAQKTLFPLLSLIAVDDFEAIIEGIANSYRDSGYLPKWLSPDERGLMPGTLVDNVLADAFSKGIGLDYMDEMFEAMIKSATVSSGNPKYGRAGVEDYSKYGYVPSSCHESVNQTLDNSLSDFSISVVAKKLGKEELAKEYFEKSKNYRNLFDPETKLLRAKDKDGNFVSDFDPLNWGSPYTEGSSYQNSYNMYHDIEGLVDLFGSKKALEERLDEMVNAIAEYKEGAYKTTIHEMSEYEAANFGHIAISNQPSFHIPYLYYYVDRPEKTQIIIKELLLNYFRYTHEGYPGDEDNGSMSAWYVLSSLGIYPLCPSKNEYIIGLPFWNKAKVHLSNGNTLVIETNENFHHKKFINNLKIDDEIYEDRKISHDKLISSGKMKYMLGIVPKIIQ